MTPTPKFGKTPLELLEPNTEYDPTFFEKYGHSILGPIMGFGMSCSANFGTKRPLIRAGKFKCHQLLCCDQYFFLFFWLCDDFYSTTTVRNLIFFNLHRCTTAYSIFHWWLFCIQLV